MNDRERFKKSLLFGNPDRVFLYPGYGLPEATKLRWYKEGLPEEADALQIHKLDHVEHLNIRYLAVPPFKEEIIEDRGDHVLARDWTGAICERPKDITTPGQIPRAWLRFAIENEDDFEQIEKRFNPNSPIRFPLWWDDMVKIWKQRDYALGWYFEGLWFTVRGWVGMENLCVMLYDNPTLVHKMMDFWTEFILGLADKALEFEPDFIFYSEDIAFKEKPMISPKMMREFMLPGYKAINKKAREAGVPVIMVDSDGFIDDLIPIWIDADVDVVCPMEIAAGTDLLALRKRFGKDMAYLGGIDKRELAKSKEDVKREIYSKVPQLLESGGYIPYCDHQVPHDVPYENYCYMWHLIKDIGGWYQVEGEQPSKEFI